MYKQIILDALKDNPDSKDVSRMIVLINYQDIFRDFADFRKYNPEWWENIGDNVYENSSNPEMAAAPYTIAISQYTMGGEHHDIEKAKNLAVKAIPLNTNNSMLHTLMVAIAGIGLGAVEPPNRAEALQEAIGKNEEGVDLFERRVAGEDIHLISDASVEM